MPGTWPRLPMTYAAIESGLIWITATMALSLLTMVGLSRVLPKTPFMRRLVLTATVGGTTLDSAQRPGRGARLAGRRRYRHRRHRTAARRHGRLP